MNLLATRVEDTRRLPIRKELRRVNGIISATLRPKGPWPKRKPQTAAERKGYGYENTVTRHFRRLLHEEEIVGALFVGQWILFSDSKGTNWAQPDLYLVMEKSILLVECKLTQSDEAVPQLLSLYLPLLRHIYNMPIVCLQVCHNLRYVPKKFVSGPLELIANPGPGVHTWHYVGH